MAGLTPMKLYANGLQIEVREATSDDSGLLMAFFRSMAAFEKLTISATEESVRSSMFGEAPGARTLLVSVDEKPIGYATYFFTFSTMLGKRGLWLEDLFIDPAFRRRGIGRVLMTHLADIAMRNQCGRFEWIVLDWNESAIKFYEGLGATILPDWRICRMNQDQVRHLAGRSDG
jgi:GNAT superfamily N-acetyltransferase